MDDVELQLRDYGRRFDDVVAPVTLADLRSAERDGAAAVPPGRGSGERSRSLNWLAVAACIAVAFAAGFVVSRVTVTDDGDERAPAETSPVADDRDSLITLPTPSDPDPPAEPDEVDPIDEVMETSIGSITWTRVEGERGSLPLGVVDRVGPTLIGDDSDPTVSWLSDDGGITWQRVQSDDVRRSAGGHEWIWQPGGDLPRLARSTPDGDVAVPIEPAVDVPDVEWRTTVHAGFDGLPVDLSGDAFVLTTTRVLPELDIGEDLLDGSSYQIALGDQGAIVRGAAHPERTVTLDVRDDGRLVDIVDDDGAVLATIDTDLPGFEDAEPIDIVLGFGTISQWSVFDGDRFAPLDTPWPPNSWTTGARVGDTIFVTTQGSAIAPARAELWSTADGVDWERVTLPGVNTETDGHLAVGSLTETRDGVILELRSGRSVVERFLTTDGRSFEALSAHPDTSQRFRGELGWMAMEDSGHSPVLWVNPDGERWERLTMSRLYDLGPTSMGSYGRVEVIGSTIYVSIAPRDQHNDRRILLIGEIAPLE